MNLYITGIGLPPEGPYVERKPRLSELQALTGDELANAVIVNKLYGDTPELVALAERLEGGGLPSFYARSMLAGPRSLATSTPSKKG